MECNFDGNTDRLFCLGAYYFFKSSRKRSKIKELTFEDNVVEQDRLACMWEEGLTDPLAEQTRHKALTEIIGQEKAIRALRAPPCRFSRSALAEKHHQRRVKGQLFVIIARIPAEILKIWVLLEHKGSFFIVSLSEKPYSA